VGISLEVWEVCGFFEVCRLIKLDVLWQIESVTVTVTVTGLTWVLHVRVEKTVVRSL
jgi:hypothetical protein